MLDVVRARLDNAAMPYPPELSRYEARALREIQHWKSPARRGWLGRAGALVGWPLEKGFDYVLGVPVAEPVIRRSVNGLVGLLNDLAQWSVRPEAIYAEYREAGHDVRCADDILELDLRDVDRCIGYLAAKYKSLALVEGASTGLAGPMGIPPDVVALVGLNLRAVGEYATYCGFESDAEPERVFAIQVLALASSPSDATKQVILAELVKIAREAAGKKAWRELEKHFFVKVVQQVARGLGVRLTRAKLLQVLPVTGAVVGGSFNAYYTAKVCHAACMLYRERFLSDKYGAHVLE